MDRSWINTPRISDAYEKGVEEFLQFAQHNAISNHNGVRIRCPCVNCLNGRILSVSEIREHHCIKNPLPILKTLLIGTTISFNIYYYLYII